MPQWLSSGTPLGITLPIPRRGIFPESSATRAQLESAEYLAARHGSYEVTSNYKSFEEYEQESAEEMKRLIDAGHLEVIGTWQDVERRWPGAMATKVATLVKRKDDGHVKTRFIVDMLRSGVNSLAEAGERIVLPRGCDLVKDVLALARQGGPLELFTADISDAFLNLPVAEPERGYAVVRIGPGRFGAYCGVPFGLALAPLLWGRWRHSWGAWCRRCRTRPRTGRRST